MPLPILALALFAATARAFAQHPTAHLTFKVPATRTELLLPQLAAATRVDLRAGPGMENDVLVIDVKDVPLDALMDRIATVTAGVWRQQGTVYRLMPDLTKRRREERAEADLRAATVRKALENRHKPKPKDISDDANEKQDVMDIALEKLSEIESQAMTDLLDGLDVSVLGEAEFSDRLVFSTSPNRYQLPFGAGAEEIINHLIASNNQIIRGIPKDALNAAKAALKGDSDSKNLGVEPYTEVGPVAKALMVITRTHPNEDLHAYGESIADGGDVQLRLYDARGRVVYSAGDRLTEPGDDGSSGDTGKAEAGNTPPAEIEYSADSRALRTVLSSRAAWRYNPPFPPGLRKKLLRPDLYDPLSYFQTDKLFAYAKSQGKPLVANLSDALGLDGPDSESKTVAELASLFAPSGPLVRAPDESFITVSPAFPAEARAQRVDRVALTALLQASQDKLIPSLDDLADYAAHVAYPPAGTLSALYWLWFMPRSVPDPDEGNLWPTLQFYGTLTSTSKSALATAGRISFESLSAPERSALERLIYGNGTEFSSVTSSAIQSTTSVGQQATLATLIGTDFRDEPTELAPNGPPLEGYVQILRVGEPAAFGLAGGYDSFALGPIYDAWSLATISRLRKRGSTMLAGTNPSAAAFQLGEQASIDVVFHVTSHVAIRQSLEDYRFSRDAEVLSEKDLLTRWQAEIAQIAAEAQKRREQNQKSTPPIHP